MTVLVRREQPRDVEAVKGVVAAAFATEDGRPPVEVGLLDELRTSDEWIPRLSLVAEINAEVVGHVVCTRAWVAGKDVLALGPLAVAPPVQRLGIGTALMHVVLGAADALDEPLVALLGHRDYYPRFGFRPGTELGVEPPVASWGDHFQVLALATYRGSLRGPFVYAKPFRDLG